MALAPALVVLAVAVGTWVAVPGGAWEPRKETVQEIQAGLEQYVTKEASARGEQLRQWSTYSFQYQGQALDGKKVLFINAFCISPPAYVEQKLVFVFDGGPCFFSVKYDPVHHKFFQLAFNGVA